MEDFFALFFPEAHVQVDWARDPEFLDKELQQVVRDADLGRRLIDKLVKVWLLDGGDAWILVHVEVQGQEEREFARRMFVLFRFIDWLLELPAADEALFWQEIQRLEEERKMPYITSVERRGMERGLQQGLEQGRVQGLEQGRVQGLEQGRDEGKREALRRLVLARFQALPEALERRIAEASHDELDQMLDRVSIVQTADDL